MGFVIRPYSDENSPLFLALTKDIGWVGVMESTRFGDRLVTPSIHDFFKFAEIKHFRTGHWAYNHFHFSTQVPARIQYVCSENVEFEYYYWKAIYSVKKAKDIEIFKEFNELEYIFVDCLINHKHIVSDGYFKNDDALLKGIVKQMKNMASEQTLCQEKVWNKVLGIQPELIKYKI